LHIFPQGKETRGYEAEITTHGGLITVRKPSKNLPPPVGGKRGKVKNFSKGSRRRLMHTMARVNRDTAGLPSFVTLTYGVAYPQTTHVWKTHLKNFYQRLVRAFPDACGIWKLEPQTRGAPHYHLLVWGVDHNDLKCWVPSAWYEIAGCGDLKVLNWHQGGFGNSHCVQKIRSWRGVRSYASKYLGKLVDCAGWESPGRFWGVFHKSSMDWSPVVVSGLTRAQAVNYLRLMRRYAHLRGRDYTSLTIMIENPARWQALLC
jgi:hypothetical protein